jgi:hypothetical protein
MEGQTVFLRIAGLSIDRLGAPTVTTIHPEQPTVAVVTIAGIAEEDLEQVRNECGVLMSWDLHPVEVLQPQEPFQP